MYFFPRKGPNRPVAASVSTVQYKTVKGSVERPPYCA
jgi:hypothetical protein